MAESPITSPLEYIIGATLFALLPVGIGFLDVCVVYIPFARQAGSMR